MQQMGGSSGDSLRQMECRGLLGGDSKPQLQPVTRMPDQQDPAVLEAKRKQQADMLARGGRDSTILSDSLMGTSGKLGA